MVINKSPDIERQKERERCLQRSEEERKKELFDGLMQESASVISLAYIFAKNFEETGVDITQRFKTAQEQNALLQAVFNKGYEEGLAKGREMEREKMNKRGR